MSDSIRCPGCGDTDGEFLLSYTYKVAATGVVGGVEGGQMLVEWVDAGSPTGRHQQPHLTHDCGHSWPTKRDWRAA